MIKKVSFELWYLFAKAQTPEVADLVASMIRDDGYSACFEFSIKDGEPMVRLTDAGRQVAELSLSTPKGKA